jgi:hypothetical protein
MILTIEVFMLLQIRYLVGTVEGGVYEAETGVEAPPEASEATFPVVTMVLTTEHVASHTWRMFGKLVAVTVPMLETVPESTTGVPTVAEAGEPAEAVRLGAPTALMVSVLMALQLSPSLLGTQQYVMNHQKINYIYTYPSL